MKSKCCEIHISVGEREKLVGRAYIPDQIFDDVYDPATALCKGTAFMELDMPYVPKKIGGYK